MEGLVLFVIINIVIWKFWLLVKLGFNVGLFLFCYGLFRVLMEIVCEFDVYMFEVL